MDQLADATGQDRFYQAARKALDFERTHFIPDENNWADLRHTTLNGKLPFTGVTELRASG